MTLVLPKNTTLYTPRPRPDSMGSCASLLDMLRAMRGATEPARGLGAIPDPFLLRGARQAAEILCDAIDRGHAITIIGDYDADGATASSVMLLGLRMLGGQRVDFLVPSRFRGGYGLQPVHIDALRERQPEGRFSEGHVIVTVDNGISAFDGVRAARDAGLCVVVTDHHLAGDGPLPDACAIVNPNQPGCTYPSKNLAGVGVAWMLLVCVRSVMRNRGRYISKAEPDLRELLDLVALGTVADVVKLDAVNRILVAAGLRIMRAGKSRPGIAAILRCAGRDPEQVVAEDMGFAVGPRINAAGRLSEMDIGIRCLTESDPQQAAALADALHTLNAERRKVEQDMREQAESLLSWIDASPEDARDKPVIVLHGKGWHEGVIGIVAGRIKESHHRPVFVFAQSEDGAYKGSGRGIDGVHLRDALCDVSQAKPGLILRFGGHAAAAGCTLTPPSDAFPDPVNAFREAINAAVARTLSADGLQRKVVTDGPFPWEYWSVAQWEPVARSVWGAGFPPPLFDDTFVLTAQRSMGKNGDHWTAMAHPANAPDVRASRVVFFGRNKSLPSPCRLIWTPVMNTFRGETSLEIRVHAAPDCE